MLNPARQTLDEFRTLVQSPALDAPTCAPTQNPHNQLVDSEIMLGLACIIPCSSVHLIKFVQQTQIRSAIQQIGTMDMVLITYIA